MFKLSETKINFDELSLDEDDDKKNALDQLWGTLESNFTKTLPFVEQTIEKWNTRTKLIGQTQGQKNSSVFNATIV